MRQYLLYITIAIATLCGCRTSTSVNGPEGSTAIGRPKLSSEFVYRYYSTSENFPVQDTLILETVVDDHAKDVERGSVLRIVQSVNLFDTLFLAYDGYTSVSRRGLWSNWTQMPFGNSIGSAVLTHGPDTVFSDFSSDIFINTTMFEVVGGGTTIVEGLQLRTITAVETIITREETISGETVQTTLTPQDTVTYAPQIGYFTRIAQPTGAGGSYVRELTHYRR